MLDKVMIKNDNEVVLIFTDRSPVSIYHSEGFAYEMYLWMMNDSKLTLREFIIASRNEDTSPGLKVA